MIIYIRDVQNLGFGQAFSKNYNCKLSLAQQIAIIVPADSPIDMVCYVKNMDIADIKVGMEAEIKLETYLYNKHNDIKGTVKYICLNSFNSKQLGSVYLVKMDVDDSNDNIDIKKNCLILPVLC